MPYSDNLYSSLDEEEAGIEFTSEALTHDGTQGRAVTSEHGQPNTNTVGTDLGSEDNHPGVADYEEDQDIFSPTDGYFGTAPGAPSGTVAPLSSDVPHVPNVLVEDPSLQQDNVESKAAEAAQERLRNHREPPGASDGDAPTSASRNPAPSHNGVSSTRAMTPTPTLHSGATYYTPSSSSCFPRVATPTSYTTFSTQRASAYPVENFPFIPSEAPPAYTPSPPVPPNTQQPVEGYRTFTQTRDAAIINMGRPEETQRLLSRQPESMRDHNAHDIEGVSSTWRTCMRRAREHANWRSCKIVLITLVLFVVAAGFLVNIITSTLGNTGSDNSPFDDPKTDPRQPNMTYPDIDGDFVWDSASFCKDAMIHRPVQTFGVNFDANTQLTLLERTVDEDGRHGWGEVHIQGAVVFRRAGSDTPQSAITLEVAVTDERLNVISSWDGNAGKLEVLVPHRVEWSGDRPRACVNVKITAWIPENSTIKHLNTNVVHLDIKLLDNLSLTVAKGTALTSTVGTITSASTGNAGRDGKLVDAAINPSPSYDFNSRIIDVHTTSAPINGAWPLYDYLGLQSTAGDIRVTVNPKEADADYPKPAILYIKTLSGDVKVREPIHAAQATFHIAQDTFPTGSPDRRRAEAQAETYLPPREYRVDVHTTSGEIDVVAAFGLSGGFKSTSGTVSLELLPVLDATQAEPGARKVELSTASTSGATNVKVLEPLWVDSFPEVAAAQNGGSGKPRYVDLRRPSSSSSTQRTEGAKDGNGNVPPPLRCLHGSHATTSANIKLQYPASWEGDISLGTLTGSLQVGGDGVRLIKAGSDWPGINKFLLARKGENDEGGKLTAKSTSGSANVWVGDESNVFNAERM